jgi:O-antigen ligase
VILFGFKDKLGVVKSLVIAVMGTVAVTALNVSGGRGMDNDDGGRVALWGTGLQVFKAHPLFGVGPGNFSNFNGNFQTAHNSYILGMAELGVFGYFFWMSLIVSGWTELSKIIGRKTTEADDSPDDGSFDSFDRQDSQQTYKAQRSVETEGAAVLAHSTGLAGFDSYAVEPKAASGWSPSYGGFEEEETIDADTREENELVYAAKILRIGMVGFLVSAFFLSRTYAIPLYLLLGMAAALRTMYRTKHPEVKQNMLRLLRNVGIAIAGSIVFLYGFVRLHGVH